MRERMEQMVRAAQEEICAALQPLDERPFQEDAWRHDALRWQEHLSRTLAFEMTPWYMRKPVIASVQGHALGII